MASLRDPEGFQEKSSSAEVTATIMSNESISPPLRVPPIPVLTKTLNTNSILPAVYHTPEKLLRRPKDDIEQFLKDDLCIPRLERIHKYLWLAGKQLPASPLHEQENLRRKIHISEQVDLHLCLADSSIFIKPLPEYLLDFNFWSQNICCDSKLYESARGFLLSYAWLVSREIDFKIAKDKELLPSLSGDELIWEKWVEIISKFLESVDLEETSRKGFSSRYQFGELDIRKLNLIYRLVPDLYFRYLSSGYHFGNYQFDAFFRRNFSWLLVAFAYTTVILTAMQLGLATNNLRDSNAFNWASYIFSVFSITVPAVAMGVIGFLFSFLTMSSILNRIGVIDLVFKILKII
jgi:hypothetical protein